MCKLVVQIPYGDSVRKLRMGKIGSLKDQKKLVLPKHILTLLCVFRCFNSEKTYFGGISRNNNSVNDECQP